MSERVPENKDEGSQSQEVSHARDVGNYSEDDCLSGNYSELICWGFSLHKQG